MARRWQTGREIRKLAARLARDAADDRAATGDPEGADVIRDLAKAIEKLPLHLEVSEVPHGRRGRGGHQRSE